MTHRRRLFFFFAMVLAQPLVAEEAVRVSMLELEGMALKRQWGEALLRVDDIPVGQREEKWRKLVTKVAVGHLSELTTQASAGSDALAVELGRRYPFLGRSEEFRRRRDDAIVAAYRTCVSLESKELDCPERLLDRIGETSDDIALIARSAREVLELEKAPAAKRFLDRIVGRVPASAAEKLKKDPKLSAAWNVEAKN